MQVRTSVRPSLGNRNIIALICLTVLAVVVPCPIYAEVLVEPAASVDRDRIAIGDLIRLTIEVTFPEETVVRMPGPEVDFGPFELRNHEVLLPAERPDGLLVSKAIFDLSVFQTGDLTIPSIKIPYFLPEDKAEGQTQTSPITVFVDTLLTDQESDIRDIKSPLEIPANWAPLIAAVLFGILGTVAATYFWRRRVQKSSLHQPINSIPKRPVDEVALEELERLRRSELLNRGEVKEYHIEAAEIIRRYLEGRFSIDALEMTSGEIVESLIKQTLEKKETDVCKLFLNQCDLVKFAKLQPFPSRCEQTLDLAFEIVNQTRSVSHTQEQAYPQNTPAIDSSMASQQISATEKEECV